MLRRHLYGLQAVAGLAYDLQVRLLLQDVAQSPADQRVVVYQENADLRGFGGFQFSSAPCWVSGRPSTSSLSTS